MEEVERGFVKLEIVRGIAHGQTLLRAWIAALALFPPGLAAQATSVPAEIVSFVEGELRLNDIPGASVAVVADDSVGLFSRGVANLRTRRPMTERTLVDLASVSKSFTALAVRALEQRGALRISDPVTAHLPELTNLENVRIQHLLEHRSGLTRDHDYLVPCCGQPGDGDLDVALQRLARATLRFRPGERFIYANGNYVLLAAVVARVAGKRFSEVLGETVFEPIGMERTLAPVEADSDGDSAAYHERLWGRMQVSRSPLAGWPGASGVRSTAREMTLYLRFLLEGGLPAVSAGEKGPYAWGWFVDEEKAPLEGVPLWYHSGDIWGANCAALVAARQRLGVAVLTNAGNGRALPMALGVAARWLSRPAPPAQQRPWYEIPDNWAMLCVVGAAVLFVFLGMDAVRRVRTKPITDVRLRRPAAVQALRAALLVAMGAYVLYLGWGGERPHVTYPESMRIALPLLTTAVSLVFFRTALVGLLRRPDSP